MATIPQHGNRTDSPKRTARGFRSAASQARRAVDTVAGSHGFAEADVLLRWAEIAGADLAARCRAVKVSYAGAKTLGATLVVQTEGARAPEIEHLAPKIIERVNRFYGYRAIGRLKITQSTGLDRPTGFAEPQAEFAGPETAPTDTDRARAADLTAAIETPGLRAALAQMGAHVLAQDRVRGPGKRHPSKPSKGPDHDH